MRVYQFKSHDDDLDNNQQQSWLFPFANMMFLMFGLYAYLYVSGNGALNSSGFGGLAGKKNQLNLQGKESVQVDQKIVMQVPEEVQKKLQDQQTLIDRLSQQAELLQSELAENKTKLGKTSDSISVREAEKKAMENEIELLRKEKEDLKTVMLSQQTENQQLVEKIKVAEEQKALEQKLRDLKEKEVKRKEAQIKNRDSQLNQTNQNIEYTNNIIATQEAEISQLRSQLLQAKSELGNLPQNLMFVLKWSTPVDLDLSVTDPNGKRFDFNRRTIAGVDGKISVESGTGPGSEIWEAQQFTPGEYKLRVTFKPNQLATKRASGFVLQASSARDSKESMMYTVDLNNRQKEIRVIVDQRGRIAFK